MISTSGVAEYSNIIVVYLTPPSSPVTRVGPNPFQNKLEVGLYLPESKKLVMQLTDIYGRKVVQESLQAPKGFSTWVMSKAQQLTPGMYILTVAVGSQLYECKVLKQ